MQVESTEKPSVAMGGLLADIRKGMVLKKVRMNKIPGLK